MDLFPPGGSLGLIAGRLSYSYLMANRDVTRTLRLLQVAQRIRVPAGFVLTPLLLVAARPGRVWVAAGCVIAVAGLGIRAWASGCLKKNEELATGGPYAYTRNPLYLGTFLLGLGVSVCTGSWWFAVVFTAFYLLVYIPVMLAESETLRKLFPDQYPAYSRSVPLLVPRLTPFDIRPQAELTDTARRAPLFEMSLYIRHREYRALLGFVAVLGILILKAYLRL